MGDRLRGFDQPTVWHEFTPLALQHGAINLGQGRFPDWPVETVFKEKARDAVFEDYNQYARPQGHLRLVRVLAERYSIQLGRRIEATTDVAIGVGATEVMYSALMGLLSPPLDEVVILEPAFDIYAAQVQMAGGKSTFVPLRFNVDTSQFDLDGDAVEAAFTARTRVLIINSPHNPTGKIFSRPELERLAAIVDKFPNVVVLCDDVYEHMAFTSYPRFATLPRMFERSLTISSAGKTFSVTGWKIGWAVGPPGLVQRIHLANNWIQFSVATPLQEAVAAMLEIAPVPFKEFDSYFASVAARHEAARDRLVAAFDALGLQVVLPQGGAFLFVDISHVEIPKKYLVGASRDYAFCRYLTVEKGVTAIPVSAFYCEEHKTLGHNFARFAYCKKLETLDAAIGRLQSLVVTRETPPHPPSKDGLNYR
ncbi:kynurenine-oxoglutarate transaminase [Achlya hypogyna]|uniref:Kynurenine-oxoglutarate transaminase n=1 Tax=Achlya hypogyna TaxID=1202772 RepID=A0A1V9YC32_ACHHY|nr:kynurenine-oxoglutarate transaminase [Achlya hypogyna]